jgi:HK97 gp10 family phage protein
VSVNYADITALAADLTRAADNVEEATQELLEHAGTQIHATAVSQAPVKTGRLRSAIRMWSQPLRVTIGPDVNQVSYGAFQEYGTGTRGEFGGAMYVIRPKTAKALRFRIGDKVVYAKSVRHPGVSPHPYMRPALTQWVDSLGDDAAKVGVTLIVGPHA